VWVQFSDAQANGSPIYPLNSTVGLLVNLATDSTAGSLNNWGWQNAAYWLSQATTVTFATSGTHTLRIQVREDGVQFDQIVLSPGTYVSSPPGPVSGDSTIVRSHEMTMRDDERWPQGACIGKGGAGSYGTVGRAIRMSNGV